MTKKLKTAGKVVKAVGLKGDVKIFPLDSYIDNIPNQEFFFIGDSPEKAKKHYTSFVTKSGKFLRYKIHDNVDRKDAENLVGKLIFRTVADNEILNEDLVGFLVVTTEGLPIGILSDVLTMPAHEVLSIDSGEKEILIPSVPEIVKKIDLKSESIIIFPMEGLLDL